jgi:hypothetical protein
MLRAVLAAGASVGVIALGALAADATPLPSWAVVALAVTGAAAPGLALWLRWRL